MKDKNFIDLASVRAGLENGGKKRFWRSLDQLADTEEYQELARREFPPSPAKPTAPGVSRRNMLKLMAASAGLAGLTACTKLPIEHIAPYVRPSEEFVPGHPLFYATSMPRPEGGALGLLVKSNMGRPTKAEGNPDHPASLGSTDVLARHRCSTCGIPTAFRRCCTKAPSPTTASFWNCWSSCAAHILAVRARVFES